jgi:hypothetical protein
MTTKPRKPWTENAIIAIVSVAAVLMAIILDKAGMPHKWHTALFGTLVPFTTVILLRKPSWARRTFWLSLWFLLALHIVFICVVFGIVMRRVVILGLLWWLPIAFVEVFVLLDLQRRLEKWMKSRTSA